MNHEMNELPAFAVLWLSAVAGTALIVGSSSVVGVGVGSVLLVFSLALVAGGAATARNRERLLDVALKRVAALHERVGGMASKCKRCDGYGTTVVCVNPSGHRNGCGCPLSECPACDGTGWEALTVA